MIEQTVEVISIRNNLAWVESISKSGCPECEAGRGCGGGIFIKIFGRKRYRLQVVNLLQLEVGERVVIGIKAAAVTRGSVAVYFGPLLGLMLGAVIGQRFDLPPSELFTLIFSLVGGVAAFVASAYLSVSSRLRAQFSPVMLRRPSSVEHVEPLLD